MQTTAFSFTSEPASSPAYYPDNEEDLSEMKWYQKLWRNGITYYIDFLFQNLFFFLGKTVARVPTLVILGCILATILCGLGIIRIQFETNPQKLWVPDDSFSVQEKNYFDSSFSPFFRIEQLIITNINLTYAVSDNPGELEPIDPSVVCIMYSAM